MADGLTIDREFADLCGQQTHRLLEVLNSTGGFAQASFKDGKMLLAWPSKFAGFVWLELIDGGSTVFTKKPIRIGFVPLCFSRMMGGFVPPDYSITDHLIDMGVPSADDSQKPRRHKSWTVYFLEAVGTSTVKIGKATDVAFRIAQIQPYCPVELKLIGVVNDWTESEIHSLFSAKRLHGEWFRLDDELMAFIGKEAEPCKN